MPANAAKRSNKLQVVLHIRRVLKRNEENLVEHMSFRCEDELTGRLFVRDGDCWDLGRTNSPTSARHGDGIGYIRIWATPPRKLVFWDGAPSHQHLTPAIYLWDLWLIHRHILGHVDPHSNAPFLFHATL